MSLLPAVLTSFAFCQQLAHPAFSSLRFTWILYVAHTQGPPRTLSCTPSCVLACRTLIIPWRGSPSSGTSPPFLLLVETASLPPCTSLHAFQCHFWTIGWFSLLSFEFFKWLHYCFPPSLCFLFLSNFNALCNFFLFCHLGIQVNDLFISSSLTPLNTNFIPISICPDFIYARLNSKTVPSSQLFLILAVTSTTYLFFSAWSYSFICTVLCI